MTTAKKTWSERPSFMQRALYARSCALRQVCLCLLSFSVASVIIAGSAYAATETWDGGHGSANAWSANLNWADDTAPSDGDDLIFSGTTRLSHFSYADMDATSANDFIINSITFDSAAGAFVISNGGGPAGSLIKLQGNIVNNDADLQTLNFPFQLNGGDRTVDTASGDITIGGVISEDASARALTKIGANTLTLSGANTYSGGSTVTQGILRITGGINSLPGSVVVTNAGTLELVQSGLTWANTITGDGTVEVEFGTGGGNTYLTGVAGFNGTVELTKTGATTADKWISQSVNAPNVDVMVNDGTTLMPTDGATFNSITVTGTGNTENRGAIRMWTGNGTLAGDMTLAGDTTIGLYSGTTISGAITSGVAGTQTLTLGTANQPGGTTLSGAIGGGVGTVALTKAGGAGTATLSGGNTYTGLTTVNAGTLEAGSDSAFATNGQLTVSAGTFDLNGYTAGFTQVNSGAGLITNSVAGVKTLDMGIVSGDLANPIGGDVALRVSNNNGVLRLTHAGNTFSGGLTLVHTASGTRMRPQAISGTPYGSGTITIGESATDKAGIYFNPDSDNQTLSNDIVCNTALGTDRPGIRVDAANLTLSGDITANLSDANFSHNSPAGSVTLTGQITGNNGLRLDNTYGSSITVTPNNAAENNNYQGNTTIEGTKGTLVLGRANQIPNGASAGNVVNSGTLNMGGFSDTINGLSGSGTIDGISGTPTLTLGDNDATSTFSGTIKNTAGSLALTKIGTGTQALSGASTYTGGTLVNAGILDLVGNNRITGALTVDGTASTKLSATANNAMNGINPLTLQNGGTFTDNSTAGRVHTVSAAITFNNGGTMTSEAGATAHGTFGNYYFNNSITVSGNDLATISAKAMSFNAAKTITVADSVAGDGTDLLIPSIIRDVSVGLITKAGAGTLEMTGVNTDTSPFDITGGTLKIAERVSSSRVVMPVQSPTAAPSSTTAPPPRPSPA